LAWDGRSRAGGLHGLVAGRVYLLLRRAAVGALQGVSVGAGISDWYTYHISNDIPDFTTDYLTGSPFRDRSLYIKTAPSATWPTPKRPC